LRGLGAPLLLGLGWLWLRPHSAPPAPFPRPTVTPEVKPLDGVTVVLDPGHGGQDPGTTAGPLSEAALTYRLANELAARLRDEGATVVFTVRSRQLAPALLQTEASPVRPVDATLALTGRALRLRHSPAPLWNRAALAKLVWTRQAANDPDAARDVFFLSLHFDQYRAAGVFGSLVCVDRRAHAVPRLATALIQQLGQGAVRPDDFDGQTGLSGHHLAVLNPARNPIPEKVLLEVATLSNPGDARLAADPVWRDNITRRITAAIVSVHTEPRSPPSSTKEKRDRGVVLTHPSAAAERRQASMTRCTARPSAKLAPPLTPPEPPSSATARMNS